MKVKYSKEFQKNVLKQSGKIQISIAKAIREVIVANSLNEITNCKKLTGLDNIYRIRIGSLRAVFLFHILINENGEVCFLNILPRGQVYDKRNFESFKNKDEEIANE